MTTQEPEVTDWNLEIVKEFRANAGRVGGPFAQATVLLLTTTGARTGRSHTNPVVSIVDDDRILIFATNGGAPKHPDWYYNLAATGEAGVELGTETFRVSATVLRDEERDAQWAKGLARYEGFAEYAVNARRTIPVVALYRQAD